MVFETENLSQWVAAEGDFKSECTHTVPAGPAFISNFPFQSVKPCDEVFCGLVCL